MPRRITVLPTLAFALLAIASAMGQKTLTATEAKDHIGEQSTVCGKVVSTVFAEKSRGGPTFLNFDEPHPDQIFIMVIWVVIAQSLVSQKQRTEESAFA